MREKSTSYVYCLLESREVSWEAFPFFDVVFRGDVSAHPTDIEPLHRKALFVAHGVPYSRKCAELMFQVFMVKPGL